MNNEMKLCIKSQHSAEIVWHIVKSLSAREPLAHMVDRTDFYKLFFVKYVSHTHTHKKKPIYTHTYIYTIYT